MKCFIAQHAKRTGLAKYEWWLSIENLFSVYMIGRYLNDGLGAEPRPIEEDLHALRILAKVKQYRQLDNVKALVNKVDEARRKHEAPVRSEET